MMFINEPVEKNNHWLFNLSDTSITGNWNYITSLSDSLYGVNSFYWADSNKVFVCGGSTSSGVLQTNCYFYNLSTNQYEPKASLPMGRCLGKLVRVKDSLYLVGSVAIWNAPDGKIFKYSPNQNTWVEKDTMPTPFLHESAVCVVNDSLIFTIGGSSSTFAGSVSLVRTFNPHTNIWTTLPSRNNYPLNMTTGHAESITNDSARIIVVGGYGSNYIGQVYQGVVSLLADSLIMTDTIVRWRPFKDVASFPFGQGVYRVGGAKWRDMLLFGPASRFTTSYPQIVGLQLLSEDTSSYWVRFMPSVIDSSSNITTFAVKESFDSSYFYLFGGVKYPRTLMNAKRFAFDNNLLSIEPVSSGIPKSFELEQNYPNPFNPKTKIRFTIPAPLSIGKGQGVRLVVFDILGREVAVLVNETLQPGKYEVTFNGENMASGVYICTISSNSIRKSIKMSLIK